MNKKICVFITLMIVFTAATSFSQTSAEEVLVKAVIDQLFKGMESGDSARVHNSFSAAPTMATVFRDKDKNVVLQQENSLAGFLKAVGTPHQDVWYEEIWNVKIQLDGDFAQAWCDYAFYSGKTFSHCGVDAFQLYKGKHGWKIFHLADTRRKTGCDVPKEIQDKHK